MFGGSRARCMSLGFAVTSYHKQLNLRVWPLGRSENFRFPYIYKPEPTAGLAFRTQTPKRKKLLPQLHKKKSTRYFYPKRNHFSKLSWVILVVGSSGFE